MKTLGIIGTAGRGEDGQKLTKDSWDRMIAVANETIIRIKPDYLVSGGAAWSDHLAVKLYIDYYHLFGLKLFLPVKFDGQFNEQELTIPFNCGRVLNHYHRDFGKVIGLDTLAQIDQVIESGIIPETGKGFHGRNTQIAEASHDILAFTFGEGERLKDGGTKDTWDKFMKRTDRGDGYHYNLSDNKIYRVEGRTDVEKFW